VSQLLKFWPILAAGLGGFLLSLCYPPFDHSGFIWVFLIPLLLGLWFPTKTPKHPILRGVALGYLFGLVSFAIMFEWLREVHPAAISLVFYLAIYPAVFGAVAATIGRPLDDHLCPPMPDPLSGLEPPTKWDTAFSTAWATIRVSLINAATWTGLEYLRGVLFTGFGWNGLGVAFHGDLLILAQAADIIGVTGLSFLIVFVGTTFAATLRRLQLEIRHTSMRPHLDFGLAVLLIIGFFFYGISKTSTKPADDAIELRTLLVQANIKQEEKWNREYAESIYTTYYKLTTPSLAAFEPDLVIWPETALPQEYYSNSYHQEYLNRILAQGDFTFIFGTNENSLGEGYFNSMMFMRGNTDSMEYYRKIHLVIVGEFLPWRGDKNGEGGFPYPSWLTDLIGSDFDRGTSTEPIPITNPEPYSVIPAICFEDTIGRLMRKFVRPEPQLIVNCTNDGWFGQSICSEQHLANAKFRCIELRRPMARAANTGVSCLIGPAGSLDDRSEPGYNPRTINDGATGDTFIDGWLMRSIHMDRNPPITFYAKHGDIFSIICGIAALALILVTIVRRFTKKDEI